MENPQYKVGDLSNLLGYSDIKSGTNFFERSSFKQDNSLLSCLNHDDVKVEHQSKVEQQSKVQPQIKVKQQSKIASKKIKGEIVKSDENKLLEGEAKIFESKNAKKKRKRQNAIVETREAAIFDGEDSPIETKKKTKDTSEIEELVSRKCKKIKKAESNKDLSETERTVYIGNIPTSMTKKDLVKLFSSVGGVVSARIRGAVSNDPKKSKKVAAITKNIHVKVESLFAYVKFESSELAVKAVNEKKGAMFDGHHLRIDACQTKGVTMNNKLTVFVGNLPFDASDEALHTLFNDNCGDVTGVRVIRDRASRMGKGFGYVEFRSMGAVVSACKQSNHLMLKNRPLRIQKASIKFAAGTIKVQKRFMGDSGRKLNRNKKNFKNNTQKNSSKKKDVIKL